MVRSTKNWYWSFEKQDYGICVQRSKNPLLVKYMLKGKDRKGSMDNEGRALQSGSDGKTIYDIFNWIYRNDYVNEGYSIFNKKHCQTFASVQYEAISRQNGRQL